jgi:hypothetical protein
LYPYYQARRKAFWIGLKNDSNPVLVSLSTLLLYWGYTVIGPWLDFDHFLSRVVSDQKRRPVMSESLAQERKPMLLT